MMKAYHPSFFLFSLLFLFFLPFVFALDVVVNTKYGSVSGAQSNGHLYWYGIPYAQAPVGPLRWQLPQPPQPWSGVRQTTQFGSMCLQPGVNGTSEDCLFLNVNSPANWTVNDPLLPVMIWIHGGSFWGGSGDVQPGFLEGYDMVFVSINYRLGSLGFFALPEIVNATDNHNAGFFGIQDQRMAFTWVQQNIQNFGGDPKRVTIAGQSAGAMSVCIHVACPRSAGLFAQALMESGSCTGYNTQAQAFELSTLVANKLDCTGPTIMECLYNKTGPEIMAATTGPIWPSMNEYEIMQQPIEIIQSGNFNKVPILAGVNHDEQSFEACPWYGSITLAQYNSTLEKIFYNPTYLYVAEMYPGQNYNPPVGGVIAAWSASRFQYPTLAMLSSMSANQSFPIFLYEFDHVPSWMHDSCLNVTHSTELAFVFGGNFAAYTVGEYKLANCTREYWTSFVSEGVPVSATCGVKWAPFQANTRDYIAFNVDPPTQMQTEFLGPYADFWADPAAYNFSSVLTLHHHKGSISF